MLELIFFFFIYLYPCVQFSYSVILPTSASQSDCTVIIIHAVRPCSLCLYANHCCCVLLFRGLPYVRLCSSCFVFVHEDLDSWLTWYPRAVIIAYCDYDSCHDSLLLLSVCPTSQPVNQAVSLLLFSQVKCVLSYVCDVCVKLSVIGY